MGHRGGRHRRRRHRSKPSRFRVPFPFRSLLPTMGVLKALAVSSFFVVSSLGASASDWRSRSIYQVSCIPCFSFSALTQKITSSSQTASRLRMGLGQLVTQRIASIAVEPTEASSIAWIISRTWDSTPSGFHQSSRILKGQASTGRHTTGWFPT